MYQGWNIKSKLSEKVSNKFTDDNYNLLKKIGTYGRGELSRAAGGGFLSFIVKKIHH
jgi:galactokinase/mevalonate kinase-like predicted kinase